MRSMYGSTGVDRELADVHIPTVREAEQNQKTRREAMSPAAHTPAAQESNAMQGSRKRRGESGDFHGKHSTTAEDEQMEEYTPENQGEELWAGEQGGGLYDDDDMQPNEEIVINREDDDEEEDDEEDEYYLFQDCQLASNRAYQTNKVQYRSLPTVDELPLDELPDDSQDLQIPQKQLISSLPTSVPIIQVDDQQTLSSSPISEVPSLCYSESDSEKEDDDEVDQVSTLSSQQVQNESQIPIKPIVQPTFKRLLLPSPEQLDMMIHWL